VAAKNLGIDMATKLAAVRALLNEAVRALIEGAHDAEAICVMVKMFASEEIFKGCRTQWNYTAATASCSTSASKINGVEVTFLWKCYSEPI
jgi:hypothetical protein